MEATPRASRGRADTPPALGLEELSEALPAAPPPPSGSNTRNPPPPPGPGIIRAAMDTLRRGDHSPCLLVDFMLAMNSVPAAGNAEWTPEDLRMLHLVRVSIQSVLARLQPRGDRARISLDVAVQAQQAAIRERGLAATIESSTEPLSEVVLLFLREHAMAIEAAASQNDNPHQHQPAIGTIQSLLQRVQPLHWGVYAQYQRSLLRYAGALHRYRTIHPAAGHMQRRALCQAAAIGLGMLERYATLGDRSSGAAHTNLLQRYGLTLPVYSTASSSGAALSFRQALESVGAAPELYPAFATCPDAPLPGAAAGEGGSSASAPRWDEFDVSPAPLVVPHVQASLVGKTLWALLSIGGGLEDIRAAGHKLLIFIAAATRAPVPLPSDVQPEDRSPEALWELCLSLLLAARDTAPDPVAAGDATLDLHDATIQYISVHSECPLPSRTPTPPVPVSSAGTCIRAALLAKQLLSRGAAGGALAARAGAAASSAAHSLSSSSFTKSLAAIAAAAAASGGGSGVSSPAASEPVARAWTYDLSSPSGIRTPASASAPPSPPTSQARGAASSGRLSVGRGSGAGAEGTPATAEAAGSPVSVRSHSGFDIRPPLLEVIAEGGDGSSRASTSARLPDEEPSPGAAEAAAAPTLAASLASGGAAFGSPLAPQRSISTSSIGSFAIAPARGAISSVGSSSSASRTAGGWSLAGYSSSSNGGSGKPRSPASLLRQFYPICAAPAASQPQISGGEASSPPLSRSGVNAVAPASSSSSVAPTPLLVAFAAAGQDRPGAIMLAPFPQLIASSPALSSVSLSSTPQAGAPLSGGGWLSLRLASGGAGAPSFLLPPPAAPSAGPSALIPEGIAAAAVQRRFRSGSACSNSSAMMDDEPLPKAIDGSHPVAAPTAPSPTGSTIAGVGAVPPFIGAVASGAASPVSPQAAVANATALRMLQLLDNTAIALELSLLALGVNIMPRTSGSRGSSNGAAPSPLNTARSGYLSASPQLTARSMAFAAPFPSPPASPAISPAALAPSPVPFASAHGEAGPAVATTRPANVPPLTRLCFRDYTHAVASDAMSDCDASPVARLGGSHGFEEDGGSVRSQEIDTVEGIDEAACDDDSHDGDGSGMGGASSGHELVFVDSALEELAGVATNFSALALGGSTPPRPAGSAAASDASQPAPAPDRDDAPPSAGRKRRGSGDQYDAYACEEMEDDGSAEAGAAAAASAAEASAASGGGGAAGGLRGRPRADTPPGPRPRKRTRTLSPDSFDSPGSMHSSSSEEQGGSALPSPASAQPVGLLPPLPPAAAATGAAEGEASARHRSGSLSVEVHALATGAGGASRTVTPVGASPRLYMPSPTNPHPGAGRTGSPAPGPRSSTPASPVGSPGRPSAFRSRSASVTAPLPPAATLGAALAAGAAMAPDAGFAPRPASSPSEAVPLPVAPPAALPFTLVAPGPAAALPAADADGAAGAAATAASFPAPIHRQRRSVREGAGMRGVRWSPDVLAVEDARRRVRAVSMDELPFSPDGTVHPSALVVLEDGRLGIPITERVAALTDPHNILLSLPSVRGMAVPAVSVSSTPVLPAGPIPSSGGSASAAPGAWPLAIPSMRCIPSHPQPHCPLSPAFGFRLWELRAAALPAGAGVLKCLSDSPHSPTAPPPQQQQQGRDTPPTPLTPLGGFGGNAAAAAAQLPAAVPVPPTAFGSHRSSLLLYRHGNNGAAAPSPDAGAASAATPNAAGPASLPFAFLRLQALPAPAVTGGSAVDATPQVGGEAAAAGTPLPGAASVPAASPRSMTPAPSPLGSASSVPSASPPLSHAPSPTPTARPTSLIDNEEYRDALVLALKRAYKAVLGEATSLVERFPAALVYYHNAGAAAAAAAQEQQSAQQQQQQP